MRHAAASSAVAHGVTCCEPDTSVMATLRMILIASIAILSLTQAHAQTPKEQPAKQSSPCFYTIAGKDYYVPVGVKVCRRAPYPYGDQYSLEQCIPPLTELDIVRRGDPRCDRYENRQ
jgi:hypothetical protein